MTHDEEHALSCSPQPAWTVDARAGAACQGEVLQGLERLLTLLQIGSAADARSPAQRTATLAALERRFGRQLSPALLATADLLQSQAATFQPLPFTAPALRQLELRVRVLENSKAALIAVLAAVTDELDACRILGGDCVDAARRTVQAALASPGAPSSLQRPLRQASEPLERALSRGEEEGRAAPLAPPERGAMTAAPTARLTLSPALLPARRGGRRSERRRPGPRSGRSPRRR